MLEEKVNQLILEQIENKLANFDINIDVLAPQMLLNIKALAYHGCEPRPAALELIEAEGYETTPDKLESILNIVVRDYSSEISAFEAYLNNKDLADEDTVLTLVVNELELDIDEFDDPEEFNWDQFDLDENLKEFNKAPIEEDQNEVYSYIVTEVIETLNLDYDEEELDYETLEFLVFEFMRELNEGTEPEIIVAKMRNQFLLSGMEPEDGELESLIENMQTKCGQHLLAMRIAQQSFEDGESSETVLPKVMQIID